MNKKLFLSQQGLAPLMIAIIIGVIALAVAGGYYGMRRSATPVVTSTKSTSDNTSTSTTSTSPVITGETRSTLTDVIGRGQNLECDWKLPASTTAEENPFNAGKLWTTGNKGRSTITANLSEGMTMEGNAVYKDNTIYSWIQTAGTKMGFKFTPSELAEMDSSMTAQQRQQAEQIKQEMNFNCQPWTPDESKFELPSDVEFR
jgi:hypothetical protein